MAEDGLSGVLAEELLLPCGVSGRKLVFAVWDALVGELLDVLLERDVLPIRIFSTVKLDTALLVGVFSECASNVCKVLMLGLWHK